jgi:hypothetical protein
MFIKLTNATKEYEGEQLLINTDYILSIFELQEKNNKHKSKHLSNRIQMN